MRAQINPCLSSHFRYKSSMDWHVDRHDYTPNSSHITNNSKVFKFIQMSQWVVLNSKYEIMNHK